MTMAERIMTAVAAGEQDLEVLKQAALRPADVQVVRVEPWPQAGPSPKRPGETPLVAGVEVCGGAPAGAPLAPTSMRSPSS